MGAVTLSEAETQAAGSTGGGRGSTAMPTEDVRFLQERVALFTAVLAALSTVALVLELGLTAATKEVPATLPAHALHAGATAFAFVAWRVLRRSAKSERYVKAADVCVTIAFTATLQVMCTLFPPNARPDLVASLITTSVTLGRAVLVPSSPKRTLVITALAWIPLLPIIAVLYADPDASAVTNIPFILVEGLTHVVIWGVNATALATVAARVIFGLRREVREAQKLGQYTLIDKLGEGGMGQVFRAKHAMLRRPTAVKLLHPDRVGGPEDLARFEREVQLTSQLSHPNVVTVFDYGRTPDGVFYYAMELLEGENLEDVVRETGPMTPARAVHVLTQVAAALAEAHAVGLIHRDVKPANIILCARGSTLDVAKVVDFGLVKDIGGAEEAAKPRAANDALSEGSAKPEEDEAPVSSGVLSRTGTVLGTPMYLAPEAMRDPASVDGRADLYALGAVAYFLLTGTPVFGGATVMEACRHHLYSKPEPLATRLRAAHPGAAAAIPGDVESIVLRLLAKNPDNRVASASELVRELEGCSVAGAWTNDDARAWWSRRDRGSAVPSSRGEEISWSAKTIAVDLAR